MGLKFAPINIPLRRRRQTLSVLSFIAGVPASIVLCLVLLWFPFLYIFLAAYVVFICLDNAPSHGGRRVEWLRRLKWWKHYRDYFPSVLIKTAELDPKKNYIFGYHPHGIISLGAWGNFATEANDFAGKFPGITLSLLTLTTNFRIPIWRDVLLAMGLCDVSLKSCNNILQSGPGRSIMIVIGGGRSFTKTGNPVRLRSYTFNCQLRSRWMHILVWLILLSSVVRAL
eukprot:Colp12_sorted_trinity150504_noHs@33052